MAKINLNQVYNAMEYKGFVGKVTFDNQAGILHGEVINSTDDINFQGESVSELRLAFQNAIETYLEYCQKENRQPQMLSRSGKFVVRLDPELHHAIAALAQIEGLSLNQWVSQALAEKVLRAGGDNLDLSLEIDEKEAKKEAESVAEDPYLRLFEPRQSADEVTLGEREAHALLESEPWGQLWVPNKLAAVEGIGQTNAKKLKSAGIQNAKNLLVTASTPKGRRELAEKTGLSHKLILEWVNRLDLSRVKGVNGEYAELLEQAGVDTVPELAQRNPENLYAALVATNREKKLVRKLPTKAKIVEWVEQARKLPRVIEY